MSTRKRKKRKLGWEGTAILGLGLMIFSPFVGPKNSPIINYPTDVSATVAESNPKPQEKLVADDDPNIDTNFNIHSIIDVRLTGGQSNEEFLNTIQYEKFMTQQDPVVDLICFEEATKIVFVTQDGQEQTLTISGEIQEILGTVIDLYDIEKIESIEDEEGLKCVAPITREKGHLIDYKEWTQDDIVSIGSFLINIGLFIIALSGFREENKKKDEQSDTGQDEILGSSKESIILRFHLFPWSSDQLIYDQDNSSQKNLHVTDLPVQRNIRLLTGKNYDFESIEMSFDELQNAHVFTLPFKKGD